MSFKSILTWLIVLVIVVSISDAGEERGDPPYRDFSDWEEQKSELDLYRISQLPPERTRYQLKAGIDPATNDSVLIDFELLHGESLEEYGLEESLTGYFDWGELYHFRVLFPSDANITNINAYYAFMISNETTATLAQHGLVEDVPYELEKIPYGLYNTSTNVAVGGLLRALSVSELLATSISPENVPMSDDNIIANITVHAQGEEGAALIEGYYEYIVSEIFEVNYWVNTGAYLTRVPVLSETAVPDTDEIGFTEGAKKWISKHNPSTPTTYIPTPTTTPTATTPTTPTPSGKEKNTKNDGESKIMSIGIGIGVGVIIVIALAVAGREFFRRQARLRNSSINATYQQV